MKNVIQHLEILLANVDKFSCVYEELCYEFTGIKEYFITSEIEPYFDIQVDVTDDNKQNKFNFIYDEVKGVRFICDFLIIKHTEVEEKMFMNFIEKVKPVILEAYKY